MKKIIYHALTFGAAFSIGVITQKDISFTLQIFLYLILGTIHGWCIASYKYA